MQTGMKITPGQQTLVFWKLKTILLLGPLEGLLNVGEATKIAEVGKAFKDQNLVAVEEAMEAIFQSVPFLT